MKKESQPLLFPDMTPSLRSRLERYVDHLATVIDRDNPEHLLVSGHSAAWLAQQLSSTARKDKRRFPELLQLTRGQTDIIRNHCEKALKTVEEFFPNGVPDTLWMLEDVITGAFQLRDAQHNLRPHTVRFYILTTLFNTPKDTPQYVIAGPRDVELTRFLTGKLR